MPSLLLLVTFVSHQPIDVFFKLRKAVQYYIFEFIAVLPLLFLSVALWELATLVAELLSQRHSVAILIERIKAFLWCQVLGG
jgi:hypothetical protein